MAKHCTVYGVILYLDCIDCEEKYCRKQKLCKTCKHNILWNGKEGNHRCEFTGNKLENEHCMRYECSKYERK